MVTVADETIVKPEVPSAEVEESDEDEVPDTAAGALERGSLCNLLIH
jgi:hypothetical protein